MASSGSVDFTLTRNEVITLSYKKIGRFAQGKTLSAAQVADASDNLNLMLKAFQRKGLKVFLRKRATLFLALSDSQYGLGTAGDNATYSYTRTQIKVAAVATATTIDVDSTSGMAAADFIGFELDDGSLQWTTVTSVTDSDTVVIPAPGLSDACAVDNYVYFYRTKIDRPLRIVEAFIRDEDSNDRPVRVISEKEYYELSNKNSDGAVTSIYYDAQLTTGQLYVWPQTSIVTDLLEMVVHRPIEDMDGSADTFDVPVEWLEPIVWGLSWRMGPDAGISEARIAALKSVADEFLAQAEGHDIEDASVTFEPEFR